MGKKKKVMPNLMGVIGLRQTNIILRMATAFDRLGNALHTFTLVGYIVGLP